MDSKRIIYFTVVETTLNDMPHVQEDPERISFRGHYSTRFDDDKAQMCIKIVNLSVYFI